MSAYTQPGGKRQKVRETKSSDVDYFQGIEKVEYNNMASTSDTICYRYYCGTERVHSRTMEDWLKLSVSLTEFKSNGSDIYGRPIYTRPWDDNTATIDNHKRCIKALFDLCSKLGIKYWTAFDTDIIPYSDSWDENRTNWDDLVEYIQDLSQRSHVKLLWMAPDLHSHPRYASGAMTNSDASTFIQAASQIKKCIDISLRLNAECFLLWPYREGYDAIFHTDVAREIKLFAKLLKIASEYKERLNYKCQLLIMPYYNFNYGGSYSNYGDFVWQHSFSRECELINTYMWDVTSCLYFLKNFNLDRQYKVCTPPGHHMYMANVYNMLGGVTVSSRFDQCNSKKLTLMMKCIVDQGITPPGGINLKLIPRRESDLRDLVTMYVKYIDAMARGLRLACSIISEQIFSKHVQQRYTTYLSGFGSRLINGEVTIEECEDHYKKNQNQNSDVFPSKLEQLEVVFQRYLDTCDHV